MRGRSVRGRSLKWIGKECDAARPLLKKLAVPSGLQLPVGRFQNKKNSRNNGENLPNRKRNDSASVLQKPSTVYEKSRVIFSIYFREKKKKKKQNSDISS